MDTNTPELDLLRKTLKHHGFSLTRPRTTVFLALQRIQPASMQQLIQACNLEMDRASVYRTVISFEKLGILTRLQTGFKYRLELSDIFQHHHHHLNCSACGKTITAPEDPTLEDRIRELAEAAEFQILDHQIEIRGLCIDCRSFPLKYEAV